ncbi:hypothetical protein BY457_10282 [Marinilabilia salmonicolor]|jgi:hypothetical protein|uniref:hypothetical protein n=1 Tax=Marinilabilia salmonicolor TaxID=989 RepID=UPI000D0606EC|nr:hypothetical protein [Marinilabilia salmonicolor]PRZ01677.1 hypothetical protein BY457_10282 [Marinilabilia salmonicolor]
MKKTGLILFVLFMAIPAISMAQRGDNAIGLRFGGGVGYDTEITFQTPFDNNRAELDLGFGGRGDFSYWKLTGLYQWVMPIESGFYWYLGVGPSLGSWAHDDLDDSGVFLAAALNAGIEYNFSEVPLQVAIDTRPELSFVNPPDDPFGFGLALSLRYRF